MKTRLDLHDELLDVIGDDDPNVYFQPPGNEDMYYPCIIYEPAKPSVRHANDGRYFKMNMYTITIIDEDPDSELPEKFEEHFKCFYEFDRFFTSDNLNHFVYSLYY